MAKAFLGKFGDELVTIEDGRLKMRNTATNETREGDFSEVRVLKDAVKKEPGEDELFVFDEKHQNLLPNASDAECMHYFVTKTNDGKEGIYDEDGNRITENKYDSVEAVYCGIDFRDVKDVFMVKNGDFYGLVGCNGLEIVSPVYDSITFWEEYEVATAKIGTKFRLLLANGRTIHLPDGYKSVESIAPDIAKVMVESDAEERYGVINKYGELIIPCNYIEVSYDCRVGIWVTGEKGKVGIVDKTGQFIILDVFDEIMFSDIRNIFITMREGLTGRFSKDGIQIVPTIYDSIRNSYMPDSDIIDGFIVNDEFRFGLYDIEGHLIVNPKYDLIHHRTRPFGDCWLAEINGKKVVVNNEGTEIGKRYRDISLIKGRTDYVKVKEFLSWRYMDKEGNEVNKI